MPALAGQQDRKKGATLMEDRYGIELLSELGGFAAKLDRVTQSVLLDPNKAGNPRHVEDLFRVTAGTGDRHAFLCERISALEVVDDEGDPGEVAERHVDPDARGRLFQRTIFRHGFAKEFLGLVTITLGRRDESEVVQACGHLPGVASLPCEREASGRQFSVPLEIEGILRKHERRLEHPALECGRRLEARGESALKPALALGNVPAEVPKPMQRAGQSRTELRFSVAKTPLERGSDVVVFLRDHVEPSGLRCSLQLRLGFLSESAEVLGVLAPPLVGLARLFEALDGVLA